MAAVANVKSIRARSHCRPVTSGAVLPAAQSSMTSFGSDAALYSQRIDFAFHAFVSGFVEAPGNAAVVIGLMRAGSCDSPHVLDTPTVISP